MKPAPQSQQARSSDGCEGSGTSEGGASQVTEEVSSHNGTDKSLLERYRKGECVYVGGGGERV